MNTNTTTKLENLYFKDETIKKLAEYAAKLTHSEALRILAKATGGKRCEACTKTDCNQCRGCRGILESKAYKHMIPLHEGATIRSTCKLLDVESDCRRVEMYWAKCSTQRRNFDTDHRCVRDTDTIIMNRDDAERIAVSARGTTYMFTNGLVERITPTTRLLAPRAMLWTALQFRSPVATLIAAVLYRELHKEKPTLIEPGFSIENPHFYGEYRLYKVLKNIEGASYDRRRKNKKPEANINTDAVQFINNFYEIRMEN